jgi:hypothetical protein
MPTLQEANGQIFEGKTVICYEGGEEHESFDPASIEGGPELCDDCIE